MANSAENIFNSIYKLALSKVYRLEVKEDKIKGIINWGKKNDYPTFLLGLSENQAEHGAILKTKSDYLSGLGIESENPQIQAWLKRANFKQDWNEVVKELDIDKPMFGAMAVKITPNIFGKPMDYVHIDYGKLRMSNCYKQVIYCEDWSLPEHEAARVYYPIWFPGIKIS